MPDTSFDIVVIGSGPGGYVTAIRAAQLGFKTAIVEKAYLGGICNNWGCIPTKALLRSAEIYHYMQHAKDYGLSADNVSFDPKAVIARSRGVVKRLNGGVEFLMKKNKIQIIWGEASLDGGGKFTVAAKQTAATRIEIKLPTFTDTAGAKGQLQEVAVHSEANGQPVLIRGVESASAATCAGPEQRSGAPARR